MAYINPIIYGHDVIQHSDQQNHHLSFDEDEKESSN